MSPHAWTEDQLVEQPAVQLFATLGWQTAVALDETFGPGGASLGRETKGEVVLVPRLRAALTALNPGLPPEAIRLAETRTRARNEAWEAFRDMHRMRPVQPSA